VSEIEEGAPSAPSTAPSPKRARRRKRVSTEVLESGSIRIRVRGVRPDGRTFDRSETFSEGTPQERQLAAERGRQALWRWAEEVEAGLVVIEESGLTLAELAERYRSRGLLTWRPSDRSAMRGPLRSFAGLDVRELTDARWRAWVDAQREKGRSAAYIRSAYFLARRIVGVAVEQRAIARIPWAQTLRWLPGEKETRTRRPLEHHEMRALIEAARLLDREGRSTGALALRLELAHHTAARPLEVCRWTPADLVQRGSGWAIRWTVAKSKGAKVRTVPLPDHLVEAMRAHWASLPAAAQRVGVFFPLRGVRGRWRARVLVRGRYTTGRLWTEGEASALREATGVADLVAYMVRHTGATDAVVEFGMSASEAQAWMVHDTLRVTQRYVAGYIDDSKVDRMAQPRRALAPTAAPTVVVHEGGDAFTAAPERPTTAATSASPRNKLPTIGADKDLGSSRGREVGAEGSEVIVVSAERARALLPAVAPLREAVRSAGGPAGWLAVAPADMDPLAVASDLATLLASGLVDVADRGWLVALEGAARARAHDARGKGPQKAVEKGGKSQRLRLVSSQ
jgi:integrase